MSDTVVEEKIKDTALVAEQQTDKETEVHEQSEATAHEGGESEGAAEGGYNSFAAERVRQREARRVSEQAKAEKKEAAALQAREMQAIIDAISKTSEPLTKTETKQLAATLALDDYNTGEQVKNYVDMTIEEKVARGIEQALANAEAKRAKEIEEEDRKKLPDRLVADIPDFKKVVTDENYDYLEYHYPEVAKLYLSQDDSYEKWAGLYKTMKRLIPNLDRQQQTKKLELNSLKPRSMSTPGATQTGDSAPFMLTKDKKAQNWERMKRQMKGG